MKEISCLQKKLVFQKELIRKNSSFHIERISNHFGNIRSFY